MNRRLLIGLAASTAIAVGFASAASAQETLTIGAVAPKTGPLAGGAAVTHWPNIQLWVEEVNGRGGLDVGGTKYMIEVIEYDDQTNPAQTIQAVQRLATRDGADFILAPYSTGINLAVAPIFNQFGYPQITSTANSDEYEELTEQFPNLFFTLGQPSALTEDAAAVLSELRDSGAIGNRVAMVNVADAFGIELMAAAKPAFEEAGFEIVYETSYPLGTQDLSPIVKAAAAADPDAFVAWSYPPDTFGLTQQAIVENLDVGAFYTAVATAFPAYSANFGAAAEGVLGIGGVDASSEVYLDYARRLEEATGSKPDYWAAGTMYASLQILEQAIEGAGTIDRATVTQYIKDNSFDTVMGTIAFDEHNNNPAFWTVGQWQDGIFKGVASRGREGAVEVKVKDGWQ